MTIRSPTPFDSRLHWATLTDTDLNIQGIQVKYRTNGNCNIPATESTLWGTKWYHLFSAQVRILHRGAFGIFIRFSIERSRTASPVVVLQRAQPEPTILLPLIIPIQHQLNRFVPADSTLVYMLYRVTECFSGRWLLYINPYEGYIIHYDHHLDGSTCHMTFMIYSDVFIYNPSGLAGLTISQNFHFAWLPIFFSIPDYLWFRRKICIVR